MPTVSKTPSWTGTPVIQERTVRVNVASRLPTSCFVRHCTMGMSARVNWQREIARTKWEEEWALGRGRGAVRLDSRWLVGRREKTCASRENSVWWTKRSARRQWGPFLWATTWWELEGETHLLWHWTKVGDADACRGPMDPCVELTFQQGTANIEQMNRQQW